MAGGRLRRWLVGRFNRAVEWRVEHQLRPLWQRLDEQASRIDEQQRRIDELSGRLDHIHGDLRWTAGEVERLIPHVASQESQLESLREKLTAMPSADSAEAAQARSLIEEIRREHGQIRVRLTGIARYEERLRALEDGFKPGQ